MCRLGKLKIQFKLLKNYLYDFKFHAIKRKIVQNQVLNQVLN